ncbi:MAG: ABC transporter ATP-binding protein [bacterium]|nr:ABC transporter ATP-binding protein [bacterium]
MLQVKNLSVNFFIDEGVLPAVEDVSFQIKEKESVGLVGESGCGKSVTALSLLKLIQSPPGKIVSGEIWFKEKNILEFNPKELTAFRGNKAAMIFQEPMTSLNPLFTIGNQIEESFRLHRKELNKEERKKEIIELLRLVGIPSPELRVNEYPHRLSGGMRQRVMIAMALACRPDILIADEPTTALDVTIQAQILELLRELKQKFNMSLFLITHDLGVVYDVCERVIVMYAGRIVEEQLTEGLFSNTLHPYTVGLLKSLPKLGKQYGKTRLETIPGNVPNPLENIPGCKFHPRCSKVMDICRKDEPQLKNISGNSSVRCWLYP